MKRLLTLTFYFSILLLIGLGFLYLFDDDSPSCPIEFEEVLIDGTHKCNYDWNKDIYNLTNK